MGSQESKTEKKSTSEIQHPHPHVFMESPTSKNQEINQFSRQLNSFGMKMVNEMNPYGNILISPFSLAQVILMVANGGEEASQKELLQLLEMDKMKNIETINSSLFDLIRLLKEDQTTCFQIANSLWIKEEYTFNDLFAKTMKDIFSAKTSYLKNEQEINSWVIEATNEKIKCLVTDIPSDCKLMAINAIYFKGLFSQHFNEKYTAPGEFATKENQKVLVQMMKLSESLPYLETDEFQAVQLEYKSSLNKVRFISTVILPKEKSSCEQLLFDFKKDPSILFQHFLQRNGRVELPRFSLECTTDFTDILKGLGVRDVFDGPFPKMCSPETVGLSQVLHKACLEVNEKGTEAASISTVHFNPRTLASPVPFLFKVNRPFLFTVQEQSSDLLLFLGKIVHPVSV